MSFVLFLGIISVMNRNSLKLLNCLICEPQLSPAPLYTLYFLSILYYAYLLAMVHVCIEKWRTEYKHTPLISRKNSRTDSQVINLHCLPLCKFLCAKCRSKLLVTKTLVKWFLALCDIANWSGETYCLTKWWCQNDMKYTSDLFILNFSFTLVLLWASINYFVDNVRSKISSVADAVAYIMVKNLNVDTLIMSFINAFGYRISGKKKQTHTLQKIFNILLDWLELWVCLSGTVLNWFESK